MIEKWKDVEGYEGSHQVSNLGRIKSLDRTIIYSNGRVRIHYGRVLVGRKSREGYLMFHLRNKDKNFLKSIHRLVAIAFIPNLLNLPFINHKDGNKMNNCVENLEWCTQSENELHAHRNNLKSHTGSKNANAKINEEIVLAIRLDFKNVNNKKEIMKKYNITIGNLNRILNKTRWSHI